MDHSVPVDAYPAFQAPQSSGSAAALFQDSRLAAIAVNRLSRAAFEDIEGRLSIHEYERQRIGRELHDSAGQLVISLELSLARLREIEGTCGHEPLIEEIEDTVRKIDNEIRTLAFLDYPAQLGERGLFGAVRSLARGFERRTGIETSVDAVGDISDTGEAIAIALLRVAQEALCNIHRHARASLVWITIKRLSGRIQLSVEDDGIGMSPVFDVADHGIGLQGMRHRVESLGGAFKVIGLKQGTRISAWVPLAA